MRNTIVLFFLLTRLICSSQEYVFEHITTREGLSQSDVLGIHQSRSGYLWFATHEGLNRYDGLTFKNYLTSDKNGSISSNLTISIDEDLNGKLWIGTQNKGVCQYDPTLEKFQCYYNSKQTPDILSSNVTYHVFCDTSGWVFVCTFSGIDCIRTDNHGKVEIQHVKPPTNTMSNPSKLYYHKIFRDYSGNLLALHNTGITRIHISPDSIWQESFLNHLPLDELRVMIDVGDSYLLGTRAGISKLKKSAPASLITHNCGRVQNLILTNDSILWVGTNQGLIRMVYDPNTRSCFHTTDYFTEGKSSNSLAGKQVFSLFEDFSGVIWIGTNGGINKFSPYANQFRQYQSNHSPGSLSTNVINTIFEDQQNNIWIGTEGGGINLLPSVQRKNYSTGYTRYYHNLPGEQSNVYCIAQLTNAPKEIWFGTGYNARLVKLIQKAPQQYRMHLSPLPINRGMILAVHEDEFGTLWLGSYNGGLYRAIPEGDGYSLEYFRESNSNLNSNTIRNFAEDAKGRLWIATANGLTVLSREEKQRKQPDFHTFMHNPKDTTSISHNYILPVIESKNGEIWIGTMGGGLNKYVEGQSWNSGTFKTWTIREGLANNTIKEIIEDDQGYLWIGSNRGLSKFNPSNSKIRNYGIDDGLQSLEFSELAGCKLHDGEILMGGVNGFNAFYPDQIKEDTLPPTVVFNYFMLHDQIVNVNDTLNGRILLNKSFNACNKLELEYTENDITIYFAALHYANPRINQYSYKLEGYDQKWTQCNASSPFAKYTNLDAGQYTFMVKASNSDGYWTPEAKSIRLYIHPPYWETLWFRIGLIAAIITTVVAIYLLKVRSIQIQKEKLERTVFERTNELIEINTQLEENKEEILAQKDELQSKQEELLLHKATLEHKVRTRTQELQKAKERAEESDKLKSAFLANMSHEIRTPMNAVVGFASLLTEEEMPREDRKNFLGQIKQNSEKLLVLIDDILAISLIEANQLKINYSGFSLNALLEDCYQTAKVNCKNPKVTLALNNTLEANDIHIYSDLFRLNQIITNLLSNAIKFTTQGMISLQAKNNEQGDFMLSVKDTGKGIPKEDLKRIFDRFRKIDSDPTILYPGVGLGLSISHKLADMLNFELFVESEEGKGSEFFIRIPAQLESKLVKEKEEVPPVITDTSFLKDREILIVEDVLENYELLERLLRNTGCNITLASNGLEAVELFKNGNSFDVVLMDIKMPVMNGIDAQTEIRKIVPNQCIIAQTAFALDSDRKKLSEHGFSNYISKPIRKEELLATLHTCYVAKQNS